MKRNGGAGEERSGGGGEGGGERGRSEDKGRGKESDIDGKEVLNGRDAEVMGRLRGSKVTGRKGGEESVEERGWGRGHKRAKDKGRESMDKENGGR